MVQANEPIIGIDLGTTNSCVGIWKGRYREQQVEIIKNSLGKETTPSWVGYEADGRIIVGQKARECPTFIYDGKRMIGKPFNDTDIQEFNQNVW